MHSADGNAELVSLPTKHAVVTDRLRDDIVMCRLAPGMRLSFQFLLSRYAVSVSPMREALLSVAAEGLVEANSRRGCRVTELSPADFDDLVRMRALVEAKAMELSVSLGDDKWEGRVAQAARLFATRSALPRRRGDLETQRRHLELHAALIAACESPRLLALARNLGVQLTRYHQVFLEALPSVAQNVGSHDALIDAALARNARKSGALLAAHVEAAAERIRPLLAKKDWTRRLRRLADAASLRELEPLRASDRS